MKGKEKPLYITVTLDVDPDANVAAPYKMDTVSSGLDHRVSLKACKEGLENIYQLITELQIPMTVFWESRTLHLINMTNPELIAEFSRNSLIENGCHGYRHEDFAGKKANYKPNHKETKQLITRATETISDVFKTKPAGFRAPYCRLTKHLIRTLIELSYTYDASHTVDINEEKLEPYKLGSNPEKSLWELPLCRGKDSEEKDISSYLWQLCEGNRAFEEYISLVRCAANRSPGGLFQLALHPWHLIVNSKGKNHPTNGQKVLSRLRGLLSKLRNIRNLEFLKISTYLNHKPGS